MPRYVDHEQRRKDILAAAEAIIAEGGLGALSFRAIGARLGGSTTMVTHFYANQSELLGDFAARSADQMREEIAAIVAEHDDPVERLDAVLFSWLLPLDDETIAQERMRINFAAARVLSEDSQVVLDTWERVIQESLRELLVPVVASRDVDVLADLLRSAWNGITLSTIEHPDHWTAERQVTVFRRLVEGIGLLPAKTKSGKRRR
jgi:AcrR family transcriptional regulator